MFTVLSSCSNRLLEELYVQLNKIETVKLKKQMPRLTSLRIDGNAITSLEFLPQLQNLRYLNISDNPLKNIRVSTKSVILFLLTE